MKKEFESYIIDNQIFTKQDKILVTVSGGIDSMVLIHLLWLGGYNFSIAHVNFGLRGEESDGDELFVKRIAHQMAVRFHVKCFDTEGYAAKKKVSLQEAARDLRYKWFEDIRKSYNYKYIVTAHQADDNVETVLYNFTKGTGLRGMRGMQPLNGHIARPLLWASRAEIQEFVDKNNIEFREDSSNLTDKYSRNYIRHHVTPALGTINPQFIATANENIQRFGEAYTLLNFFIDNIKINIVKVEGENTIIDTNALSSYPSVETLLYEILKDYNFHPNQVIQILQQNSMKTKTGTTFKSDSHVLLIDRCSLVIKKRDINKFDNQFAIETDTRLVFTAANEKVVFTKQSTLPIEIIRKKEVAQLNFEKLSFPLLLRRWRKGDAFQPFGMAGKTQKLSDYFVHHKISNFEKEKIWILETAKGEICWVVGHRIDERFKITEGVTALKVDLSYF